jgi:hypothetical protein
MSEVTCAQCEEAIHERSHTIAVGEHQFFYHHPRCTPRSKTVCYDCGKAVVRVDNIHLPPPQRKCPDHK